MRWRSTPHDPEVASVKGGSIDAEQVRKGCSVDITVDTIGDPFVKGEVDEGSGSHQAPNLVEEAAVCLVHGQRHPSAGGSAMGNA